MREVLPSVLNQSTPGGWRKRHFSGKKRRSVTTWTVPPPARSTQVTHRSWDAQGMLQAGAAESCDRQPGAGAMRVHTPVARKRVCV